MAVRAGVLALQGDVEEHARAVRRAGAVPVPVRRPEHLDAADAFILPGGESTTLSLLLRLFGLDRAIRARVRKGMAVYGTCAGAILMAKKVDGKKGFFGWLDVEVSRNAYGPQVESFQATVRVRGVGRVPAFFIRAPRFVRAGPSVQVLAEHAGEPVLVQRGRLLAGAFHPELSASAALHRFFLQKVAGLPLSTRPEKK